MDGSDGADATNAINSINATSMTHRINGTDATNATDAMERSPFHAGEQLVQERLGVRAVETWARRVVRDHLPEEHRRFHAAQPFLVAAARDREGRPWATLLVGNEGFVESPDPYRLSIRAQPVAGDALEGAIVAGSDVGLLGIELATRRRNRLNGRIESDENGVLVCHVAQSFGNCPQYIRERAWRRVGGEAKGEPQRARRLTPEQQSWIARADTFFIASGYRGIGESAAFGMDASHRGGEPGFVGVTSDREIFFPDYAGNDHFNTLGNLVLDPRAGLLFVDFATGGLLQLTGRATIDWNPDAAAEQAGARRIVRFELDEVVSLPHAIALRWDADADAGLALELRLVEKCRESDDAISFLLEAADGRRLPGFEAGQHLPIELDPDLDLDRALDPDPDPGLAGRSGHPGRVRRTYSLSGSPRDSRYRITVKREPGGVASGFLHDRAEPGMIFRVGRPAGELVIGCGRCPVVLVAAGIGATPLVSMLHSLVAAGDERPVWFVHGVRDGRHHPFAEEVRALARRRPGIRVHFRYSRPLPEDRGYDDVGRIDAALLDRLDPGPEAHWILCGPTSFLVDIRSALERRGVPETQVQHETFGPVRAEPLRV